MLKKVTLARWIILFSMIGAAALGWFGWNLRQERLALQDALATKEVEALSQGLLVKALQHSQLYREFENTGTGPQDNLASYIARRAADKDVRLGAVSLSNREESLRGALDKKIRIEPQLARGVERTQVANFLYYLEKDSRRLYVTSVKLEPEQKRLKEHEVPDADRWLWEAEVTVRQKRDE